MIPTRIKSLFQFIEYLHSNIDNFNLNNDIIKELELLNGERQKLSSKKTFKDKLKYDEVQAEIETKFKKLQGNTANLIKAKAKELNVCNFDSEPNYSFNGIETDIHQLKENFSKDDLPEIFEHKQLYIEYRTKTHQTFLSLAFFIEELDEVTKSLFDYFKETEQNEFKVFETKAIPVNNIAEAVQGFKQGQTKFIIPNFMGKTQNRIQEQLADFNFFQIEVIADLEFEGKTYKNIKQRNNDSILKPENWEQHKDAFFKQRMETYPESYKQDEKIKLELEGLEKLTINKTDYNILKERYKKYLINQTDEAVQETLQKKESETLSDLITHQNSFEVVEKIKIQYKNIKGKSLKLLLKALQDLDLLPKERIASKFYKACKNEFNWSIASYNAMNGYKYNDVTDKEELEQKISYLKSIIETK